MDLVQRRQNKAKGDAAEDAKEDADFVDWSGGKGILPDRETIGPILLMATTPCFSIDFFHVSANMRAHFLAFAKLCLSEGLFSTIYNVWPDPWDPLAWKMIGFFLTFEVILQMCMSGKDFKTIVIPKGNVPIYKANGMQSYICTLAILLFLHHFELFHLALVYDKFGEILSAMNDFALAFFTMLLVKGRVAPTG